MTFNPNSAVEFVEKLQEATLSTMKTALIQQQKFSEQVLKNSEEFFERQKEFLSKIHF